MKYYVKYSPVFNNKNFDEIEIKILNEKLYIKKIRNEEVLEFFVLDENTIVFENKTYIRNAETYLFEEPIFSELPYIYKGNEDIYINVLRFYNTAERPVWDTSEFFEVLN